MKNNGVVFIIHCGYRRNYSCHRHEIYRRHKEKMADYCDDCRICFIFYCLSQAMQVLPSGVAYAVWTGIGSIGVTAVSLIWFKERFQLSQLISLCLILAGVIGLRLTS